MERENFSRAVKRQIHKNYNNRCVFCLEKEPVVGKRGWDCAHIIAAAGLGKEQLALGVHLGILTPGYSQSSVENGILQCPSCHATYFTSNQILAFSLAPQVLRYILNYLEQTEPVDQKPLHEVFRLLKDAARGKTVDLPNTASVLPFLNLYTLVVPFPDRLSERGKGTAYTPDLRILKEGRFRPAPARTLPGSTGVARIYDVFTIPRNRLESSNRIPLSPTHPEFTHQRYWRLSAEPGAMLMVFLECSRYMIPESEEVRCSRDIYTILSRNGARGVSLALALERKRPPEDQDNDQRSRKLPRTGQHIATECKSELSIKRVSKFGKSNGPGPRTRKRMRI